MHAGSWLSLETRTPPSCVLPQASDRSPALLHRESRQDTVEHPCSSHLRQEITFINTKAIILLGANSASVLHDLARELASPPDLRPVKDEDPGDNGQHGADASEHARCAAVAQLAVHLGGDERECPSKHVAAE